MYQSDPLRVQKWVMEPVNCFQSLLEFVLLQFTVFIVYSIIRVCQPHFLKQLKKTVYQYPFNNICSTALTPTQSQRISSLLSSSMDLPF